jgi:hypothetical protein
VTSSDSKELGREYLLGKNLLAAFDIVDRAVTRGADEKELDSYRRDLEAVARFYTFEESFKEVHASIVSSLSGMEDRLDRLVDALENECPWPDDMLALAKPGVHQDNLIKRFGARTVISSFIDDSLLLYALGRNAAAIVDLHAILERQAVDRLAEYILQPDRLEIGRPVIERRYLPELASLLQDCGILGTDDVKYSQRLNRIRNGLAHRNMKLVSNALFSGQDISQLDLDARMSEIDISPLIVQAVRFLMKILQSYEEEDRG